MTGLITWLLLHDVGNANGKHAKTRGRSIVYPLSFEWNILSELTEEAAYSRCQTAHLRWGEKSAMNDGFVSISKNRHNSALISSAVFQRAVKTLHVKKIPITHTHSQDFLQNLHLYVPQMSSVSGCKALSHLE